MSEQDLKKLAEDYMRIKGAEYLRELTELESAPDDFAVMDAKMHAALEAEKRASATKKRRRMFTMWGSLAACLAVGVFAAVYVMQNPFTRMRDADYAQILGVADFMTAADAPAVADFEPFFDDAGPAEAEEEYDMNNMWRQALEGVVYAGEAESDLRQRLQEHDDIWHDGDRAGDPEEYNRFDFGFTLDDDVPQITAEPPAPFIPEPVTPMPEPTPIPMPIATPEPVPPAAPEVDIEADPDAPAEEAEEAGDDEADEDFAVGAAVPTVSLPVTLPAPEGWTLNDSYLADVLLQLLTFENAHGNIVRLAVAIDDPPPAPNPDAVQIIINETPAYLTHLDGVSILFFTANGAFHMLSTGYTPEILLELAEFWLNF